MGKIEKFLEALANSSKVDELVNEKLAGNSPEEEFLIYSDIAGKLGYDISGEELRKYAEEVSAARRSKTEETAEGIRNLPEDELSAVSGGGFGGECKNTYKSRENCWKNDGCDNIVNYYNGYVCKWYFYTQCEVAKHG